MKRKKTKKKKKTFDVYIQVKFKTDKNQNLFVSTICYKLIHYQLAYLISVVFLPNSHNSNSNNHLKILKKYFFICNFEKKNYKLFTLSFLNKVLLIFCFLFKKFQIWILSFCDSTWGVMLEDFIIKSHNLLSGRSRTLSQ